MRYYSINILNDDGSDYFKFSSLQQNGDNDPGALNVEFDIPVSAFAEPLGETGQAIRVWGPSVQHIGAQSDLAGKQIKVSGGMSKGLPLATRQAAQQGILVQGYILQAFANWINTDMTLDVLVFPPKPQTNGTGHIILWQKGQLLADAIRSTLQTAYPGMTINISISNNLMLNYDAFGYYNNLVQLAQWVKQASAGILKDTPNYNGVDIVFRQNQIFVYDATTARTPKQLDYADLIGQPTWFAPGQIQITTVMRGDLSVGDFVQLPQNAPVTTNVAPIGTGQYLGFQGSYEIISARHVGNFRQPDGEAWVTVFTCAFQPLRKGTVEVTEIK